MKNYDAWKFREDGERMVECPKHGSLHLENDPCDECYDRSERAALLRKRHNLKLAKRIAMNTHGLHDAINQYMHEHLNEGGRVY